VLTVLSGGVGAARLLAGIVRVEDPSSVTAVVNVADDVVIHGLHVAPDLDTVTYTLAGLHNEATGWGIVDESWRVMDELATLGGPTWFRLGDRDLATHLYRTGRLRDGASLHEVAGELARSRGVRVRILPVTDDRVATRFTTRDGTQLGFQEYFVEHRHNVEIAAIEFDGATAARPAPGVIEAIEDARRVILAPSNPLISVDPILAVHGVREAVARRRDDVVAVSPIVGGVAIKGPADRLLRELGHEVSALGVARHYVGLVGTFVVDRVDAAAATQIEALGMRCLAVDTVMSDPGRAAALAEVVAHG